ncbi:malto-oligosyltrehalose trehalohydrolase [Gloeothece citriformis PCC 7424]|uniref:Malto-oligosyltrehalose trehalohydrolase n=1 Tax=Gloeothece citriformis (strain PCC 7424) TaxID=65393 RepID=B7KBK5_GLOC7|nr:malto-oligosyltrehalose trehalohydrolase [Gloeothece citriformis]ACK72983.1 malto-oligosyltrehalose trehalohydrolase [Gloeothece citriformis PCC 7424]
MKIGATYLGNNECQFRVWSPLLKEVAVEIVSPNKRLLPMTKDDKGYWTVKAKDIPPDTLYWYQLEGEKTRPDPASNFQPKGVHEPSQVIDHSAYLWEDEDWTGIPFQEWIIYELHVGTFTPEGTFEAIISRLPDLKELGINVIEIMPVAQFPGARNWGYDGVYPYAVQNSYGGVNGLKKLVDACHQQGLAIILDVVYNHLGPEGNYVSEFAPFFTLTYNTPWGTAVNFDDAHSYGVRNFVIENALYWLKEFHFDGLRLDAIHAIYDLGAKHILAEIVEAVEVFSQQQGRPFYLIAESDLNDVRVINPQELGGHGMTAQWSDDFHHCVHTLVTQESLGYYQDFGSCQQLAKVLREGFAYTWNYSPSRRRYHGSYGGDRPPYQMVVCIQNHDQVGNRMLGERLTHLTSFDALKLAATTLILSPFTPLLFMGEEYGEDAPFLYFIDHSDPHLIEAVRKGRKEEFLEFHAEGEPPDADSIETFKRSTLNWEKRKEGNHKVLWDYYRELIQLRRQIPALYQREQYNSKISCVEEQKIICYYRWSDKSEVICLFNFHSEKMNYSLVIPNGNWEKRIDSSETKWNGKGAELPDYLNQSQTLTLLPYTAVLYEKKL